MPFSETDPLMRLVGEWLDRRDDYARFSPDLARLAESFLEDLVGTLRDLTEVRVFYDEVEGLTGIPLKTLQNQKVPNVGTKQRGEYRLGDLPFREGAASPARLLAAYDQLVDQRDTKQANAEDDLADAERGRQRNRALQDYQQSRAAWQVRRGRARGRS